MEKVILISRICNFKMVLFGLGTKADMFSSEEEGKYRNLSDTSWYKI